MALRLGGDFTRSSPLPGATRSTSLFTQLLDFKFNTATFEQVWEATKTRYERQSGQPLPDGVFVAK